MKIVRVYTGPDQRSHFEDLEVPFSAGPRGDRLSPIVAGTGVVFRETPQQFALGLHPAPRRQLVVTLSGQVEVECGDGDKRRFGPGDVMLAEDVTGEGHSVRELAGPRLSLFIPLTPEVDLTSWRTRG